MKRLKPGTILILLAAVVFTSGCSSSGTVSKSENKSNKTKNYSTNYWTLEDYLRRATGVRLQKFGGETYVIIRGNNSISNLDSQPLYVLDGQKAGRSFSQVSNMLAPGEIISVEVLSSSATSLYGMEGNYGVIVIESRLDVK